MNILYLNSINIFYDHDIYRIKSCIVCELETQIEIGSSSFIRLNSKGRGYSNREAIDNCIKNFLNKNFSLADYNICKLIKHDNEEFSNKIDKVINRIPFLEDYLKEKFYTSTIPELE